MIIQLQRAIISGMIYDNNFFLEAKKIIKSDYFSSDAHKWIIKQIILFDKITPAILINEFKDKCNAMNEDLKQIVGEELKLILKKNDLVEANYSINILKDFIERQELETHLYDAVQILKSKNDVRAAKNKLKEIYSNDDDNEFIKTINIIDDFEDRINIREEKVRNNEVIFYPTGIKLLDQQLGGPQVGEFWSWYADTNMGKSALAMNMGKICMLMLVPVWHIVVEDMLEMTMQRYDTSLSGLEYLKLTKCDYTKEEKNKLFNIFELLKKKRDKYLYVTKIEEGCTMAEIEEEYKNLQNKYGFKPNVIILDSPYNMEPTFRRENYRLNCSQIYKEIRKFTRYNKVAFNAYDQSKQSARGIVADLEDASSESYDKARIVDGFITINQTRIQKKEGIMELFVAKMKGREKYMSFFIRPCLNIMRFDSIEK